MSEIIRLDDVSLWRRTQEEFSYDLKKTLLSFAEGKYQKPTKKLVIDSINLKVDAGEKVGIIGANGAGKSTLLKLICGILKPTHGTVKVKGSIAPLIELGAGFDGELPVLDNILMYGIMLGASRQDMHERTQSILDFAELKDYAHTPVKALSSGMVARLGFAIATDIKPDILILDEVLSVGDESFKRKSQTRINQFWQNNSTILVVSHALDFINQSCSKAFWLHQGSVKSLGLASDVIAEYTSYIEEL